MTVSVVPQVEGREGWSPSSEPLRFLPLQQPLGTKLEHHIESPANIQWRRVLDPNGAVSRLRESFVSSDPPTPRFYPVGGGHSRSTAGCLYRVRPHLFVIRSILGESELQPLRRVDGGVARLIAGQSQSRCCSEPPPQRMTLRAGRPCLMALIPSSVTLVRLTVSS